MRLKFITEEGLLKAKSNYSAIYKEVILKKNKTLEELFGDDNLIRETSIEIEDFSLDMSAENAISSDVENIRRVYSHMKGLTESQASDERIWAAYTLSEYIDYMRYRWMPISESDKYERYFFKNVSKRSLFRNGVSRLWWIGRHTYDPKRLDPYELTSFICRDQDYINQLLDIGFASNPIITKAALSVLLDAENAGVTVDRELVRSVSRHINLLGGIYILDCMTYDEIYKKIKEHIKF